MLLPKPKRRAIAAIYAFAREVDDIADDPGLENGAKRERLEELRAGLDGGANDECDVRRARRRAPPVSDSGRGAPRPHRRRHPGHGAGAVRDVRGAPRLLPARRRGGRASPASRSTGRQSGSAPRRSASPFSSSTSSATWPRTGRSGACTCRRTSWPSSACPRRTSPPAGARAEWRALMAHQAKRARSHLAEGRTLLPRLDRRSAACVAAFANLYAATLDRIEERGYDVFDGPPQLSPLTKLRIVGAGALRHVNAAVVGGGLAGLAAALELADQGHAVTLYEARPTLGGAVQTLPEREGDPSPPPDNGQHIALGCFTEYLRFLDRIGEGALLPPAVARAAGDRRGRPHGDDRALAGSFLRYRHLSIGDRLRVARAVRRLPARACPRRRSARCSASSAVPTRSIDGFWDVFVRPALNLRTDEVSAEWGVFTVRTALLAVARGERRHPARRGRWAGCTATPRAARSRRPARPFAPASASSLSTISTPTPSSSPRRPPRRQRLLGEPDPGLEHSPIVSVHLLFDRAAACGLWSDGWIFEGASWMGLSRQRTLLVWTGERPGARALADRERPPALRPPVCSVSAGGAARQRRALGLRPRRAHRAGTGRGTSVFDGGVERRTRADGDPRARARGSHRRPARRAARCGRAPLVARQP